MMPTSWSIASTRCWAWRPPALMFLDDRREGAENNSRGARPPPRNRPRREPGSDEACRHGLTAGTQGGRVTAPFRPNLLPSSWLPLPCHVSSPMLPANDPAPPSLSPLEQVLEYVQACWQRGERPELDALLPPAGAERRLLLV